MSGFGATSTADDVLEGRDLTGRTAFITGGYSGLGHETARAMAAKGAHIIIAGRDEAKLASAAAELKEQTGAHIDTIVCDLASQTSVKACAAEANTRFEKIDLLINNAGVMACPQSETTDGFEMQFGTNHLGHFTLTSGLLPLVEKGENPRIINLSSRGHHISPVHLDDPNYEGNPYQKWDAYGQSKTANVLFSVSLEEKLKDRGIRSLALHPGGIVTNLGRHMTPEDYAWMRDRMKAQSDEEMTAAFKTIPQGAATTCWAATAEDALDQASVYCEDCHVAQVDDEDTNGGVRSYAIDPGKAEQLWQLSEAMTGHKFFA